MATVVFKAGPDREAEADSNISISVLSIPDILAKSFTYMPHMQASRGKD